MQNQDSNPVDLSVHGKIGEAIAQVKRTAFAFHKHGMPLRQALDSFGADIANRFEEGASGRTTQAREESRSEEGHKPLTDFQIESLAEIVCCAGDDPTPKAEALLILADEIERADIANVRDAAYLLKQMAFKQMISYDSKLVDAQVQMLRAELPARWLGHKSTLQTSKATVTGGLFS